MSTDFFAVYRGKVPGVYASWEEAASQNNGKHFSFKKFKEKIEAEQFVKSGDYEHNKGPSQSSISNYFKIDRSMGLERFGIGSDSSSNKITNEDKQHPMFTNTILCKATQEKPWADFDISKKLVIFAAGASIMYKEMDRAGIGIHFPQEFSKDVSIPMTIKAKVKNTINRANLWALYSALDIATTSSVYKGQRQDIFLYTESEKAIKYITTMAPKWQKNNWKTSKGEPVPHVDILKPLMELYIHNRVHLFNTTNINVQLASASGRTRLGFAIAERLACSAASAATSVV